MEENKKQKLLIVDDEEMNIRLFSAMLKNQGYAFETARNGVEGLEKAKKLLPDLILLDIMMPMMDGYEVCKKLKEAPDTQHIPIVLVTALSDRDSRIKGLEAGANDFLTKPVDFAELTIRTKNILKIKEFEDFLKEHNKLLETRVEERTLQLRQTLQELSNANEQLNESSAKLKEGYIDTIHRLTRVAEYRDEETSLHIKRTGHYCMILSKWLGWQEDDISTIYYASPMHDIGKVGIPSDIILKPGKLNLEEFALMKTHSSIGEKILHGSPSNIVQMAEKIAATHHERWDGTGYPRGLKGEDIPIEGRIMNIVDQYDALRSKRPYKPPFEHDKTFKIITEGDDRTKPWHFAPQILKAFKETAAQFEEVFEKLKD